MVHGLNIVDHEYKKSGLICSQEGEEMMSCQVLSKTIYVPLFLPGFEGVLSWVFFDCLLFFKFVERVSDGRGVA